MNKSKIAAELDVDDHEDARGWGINHWHAYHERDDQ